MHTYFRSYRIKWMISQDTYVSLSLVMEAEALVSSAFSVEQSRWPYTLHTANPRPSYPTDNAYPSLVHEIVFTSPYDSLLGDAAVGDHCLGDESSILCEKVGVEV
jgi:hypothetical protein